VTLWGLSDRDSWLNNWPVVGRTSYPLLFDRKGDPKPALLAVEDILQK
jgi:endo-1,4-beta-xylanase